MQDEKPYTKRVGFEELLPSKRSTKADLGQPNKRACNGSPIVIDIDFFLRELDEIFTNPNKRVETSDTLPKNTADQLTRIEDTFQIKKGFHKTEHKKEENNEMIIDIQKIQDEINLKLEENDKLEFPEVFNYNIDLSLDKMTIPEKINSLLSKQDLVFSDTKTAWENKSSQLKQNSYENKSFTSTNKLPYKSKEIDLSSLKAEIPKPLQPLFSLPYIIKPLKPHTTIKSISYKIYKNSI